jgi:hypothetical protein
MRFVFFETQLFSRLLSSYLDDAEFRRLQAALMRDPERGDLMPGTGGFRKLRWRDARRGKGKRGGLRVIYYVLAADEKTRDEKSALSLRRADGRCRRHAAPP